MKHKKRARKKTGAPTKTSIKLSAAQQRTLAFLRRYGYISRDMAHSIIRSQIGRYPTKPLNVLSDLGLVRQLAKKAVPTAKGRRVTF